MKHNYKNLLLYELMIGNSFDVGALIDKSIKKVKKQSVVNCIREGIRQIEASLN